MSSHREAPEIAKDPVADSTDVYAFVSPDRPGFVTLIANYLPLEFPAGGPNFFEFGDDVTYRINVDNDGDGEPDVIYDFRFTTTTRNPNTFLYNTGPISSFDDPDFNRPQTYTLTRFKKGKFDLLGKDLPCPPCNVGPRSTPNYPNLGTAGVRSLKDGSKVFAGQRLDGFYVDLGAIFDLGDLRPFQNAHLIPMAAAPGVDALTATNVHTLALQVPISDLTRDGSAPTDSSKPEAVIGVWTSAYRQKGLIRFAERPDISTGPWIQVSRLGNPLFNEVVVPMGRKDEWNSKTPAGDKDFAQYVNTPELAGLLPVLYPGVFPNLAAYKKPRADLNAILLTGIPAGIIDNFQNFTGKTEADELRLNVAIKPSKDPSIFGILGGDLAGFPNGRRPMDHVVAIELRAIAGATLPLVDKTFKPDTVVKDLTDGLSPPGNVTFLPSFPYLDHPKSGFDVIPPK